MTDPSATLRSNKIFYASRRLEYLESLRGLAAFFVVLHHHYMTAPVFIEYVRFTPLRILINGRSSVIFFFVLSGFVIVYGILNKSREFSYPNFVLRRFIRIYLPYAASGLLAIVFYLTLNLESYSDTAITFNEMWSQPLRLSNIVQFFLLAGTSTANTINTVAWSLVYELRISLLLPLLYFLGIRFPWTLWLFIVAELVANRFRQDSVPFFGTDVISGLDVTIHFVLPFVLGIFLAIRFSQGTMPDFGAMPVRATLLLCLSLILLMIFRDEPASLGAAILIFVAVGSRRLQDFLRWPILIKLGTISYSLYLTHAIVLQATVRVFHGVVPIWVSLAISLAACIAIAVIFYHFVEKPTHQLSQRISRRSVSS
ncbi:acyltransferase [Methylobacterium sp. WL64]|uniref:acyltransferase family protein n=1 Tax=Methylobacterium sp. WL64 TaxID=2603894 RepID=UPI0011CC14D0|nr:acyltransferase [Methylobacterium sp. WL64]TXM96668.1 acyltransferase [Methylobacterium sp. WL64]